ncbi:MAG TPA: hypothetical protein PKZ22_14755, partial [Accumulibacter sp.]|nr:hypothetical protein [Accumulibacter sp.]
ELSHRRSWGGVFEQPVKHQQINMAFCGAKHASIARRRAATTGVGNVGVFSKILSMGRKNLFFRSLRRPNISKNVH